MIHCITKFVFIGEWIDYKINKIHLRNNSIRLTTYIKIKTRMKK